MDKVRFYVGHMPSKLKVHVTVGHQTVMGEVQFFGLPDGAGNRTQEGVESIMSRMDALTVKVTFAFCILYCSGYRISYDALAMP